ncbi:MAG: two-component system sensor histidine kinase CreC [Rhodothermales bacterium]
MGAILPIGFGFYLLANWIMGDVRRSYLESMEEVMVDMAAMLASVLAEDLANGETAESALRKPLEETNRRQLSAQIYEKLKTDIDLRVYVTDTKGIVQFDSADIATGQDFSRWNDVMLTLRGEYGARSTRSDSEDPRSSVLHIAAPVLVNGEIVGALTICKPTDSVTPFMDFAKRKVTIAAIWAGGVVALLLILLTIWVTRPTRLLTQFATQVSAGNRPPLPALGSGEIAALGQAFEGMRDELEGRQYAERYIQTLTHEMKSPLSALLGAAELLEEEMPLEERSRFLGHIRKEGKRLQEMAERLSQLSVIENRKQLDSPEKVELRSLCEELIADHAPVLQRRQLRTSLAGSDCVVMGERFLLRHALLNLLQNATDFAPEGSEIAFAIDNGVTIRDHGPGIPEFALARVYERFYSLPRPEGGAKSTGLGLSFASEVAQLHGGQLSVENHPQGGVIAALALPH